jgi:hypothetical protein
MDLRIPTQITFHRTSRLTPQEEGTPTRTQAHHTTLPVPPQRTACPLATGKAGILYRLCTPHLALDLALLSPLAAQRVEITPGRKSVTLVP